MENPPPKFDSKSLTARLKEYAAELGFEISGVAPAVSPSGYHRLLEWIDLGYAGEMSYLPDRADAYQHPDSVLPGVKSIVILAMNYHIGKVEDVKAGHGKIASYAQGAADYHDVIHKKLKRLRAQLWNWSPGANVRGVVDTAPLLEREFAMLAGIGWIGKNTLVLNREYGSYFFLAALLTDIELEVDVPFESNHCGTCTACLDACPTDAFPQPYVLDATRCISYLTIEHRNAIPDDLAGRWDDWLFGCDVCQQVCPWNGGIPETREPAFRPLHEHQSVELAALFDLDDDQFRTRFRKTPLWRTKRRGILRNAALLLAAQRPLDDRAKKALQKGAGDDDPLVRDACRWTLRR